jgi:hypothetical protein
MTRNQWHIGDEVAAEARHERRAEGIEAREEALMRRGGPAGLAEIRAAHEMTAAQMARALAMPEHAVTALEAAGITRADPGDVAAYLAVLVLELHDGTACSGDVRIPIA